MRIGSRGLELIFLVGFVVGVGACAPEERGEEACVEQVDAFSLPGFEVCGITPSGKVLTYGMEDQKHRLHQLHEDGTLEQIKQFEDHRYWCGEIGEDPETGDVWVLLKTEGFKMLGPAVLFRLDEDGAELNRKSMWSGGLPEVGIWHMAVARDAVVLGGAYLAQQPDGDCEWELWLEARGEELDMLWSQGGFTGMNPDTDLADRPISSARELRVVGGDVEFLGYTAMFDSYSISRFGISAQDGEPRWADVVDQDDLWSRGIRFSGSEIGLSFITEERAAIWERDPRMHDDWGEVVRPWRSIVTAHYGPGTYWRSELEWEGAGSVSAGEATLVDENVYVLHTVASADDYLRGHHELAGFDLYGEPMCRQRMFEWGEYVEHDTYPLDGGRLAIVRFGEAGSLLDVVEPR